MTCIVYHNFFSSHVLVVMNKLLYFISIFPFFRAPSVSFSDHLCVNFPLISWYTLATFCVRTCRLFLSFPLLSASYYARHMIICAGHSLTTQGSSCSQLEDESSWTSFCILPFFPHNTSFSQWWIDPKRFKMVVPLWQISWCGESTRLHQAKLSCIELGRRSPARPHILAWKL